MSIFLNKKHEMPVFIQGMYGFVIAFAAIKFTSDFTKHVWESFGSLLFLLFTITMIAHDWYTYHMLKNDGTKKFKDYLPQVFSLFFLAQMTLTAATVKFYPSASNGTVGEVSAIHNDVYWWFVYGFFYTVCNIIQISKLWKAPGVAKKSFRLKYGIHIAVCLIGCLLNLFYKKCEPIQTISLWVAAASIVFIWWKTDTKIYNPKIDLANKSFPILINIPATDNFGANDGFTIEGYPPEENIKTFFEALAAANSGGSEAEKDTGRKNALSALFKTG